MTTCAVIMICTLIIGVPIKLYFDLEYKMSANPSLNPACGAELVNVFVKVHV